MKSLAVAVAGFLQRLAGAIGNTAFWGKLGAAIKGVWEKLLERIPAEKRHIVMICAGGGAALVLLVFAAASLLMQKSAGEAAPAAVSPQVVIPPEELFLPEEPDFVPGVMLERERRTAWTAEDAAPYWQDPLKNGEEQWRQRVELAIDELLERVP
ncbi:hypothetical protein AGMMS50293_15350 [Spirochaetia bacterium]|nr:hypothetical protein AGMMS50293_15350 [Spirochaetia bacterium]